MKRPSVLKSCWIVGSLPRLGRAEKVQKLRAAAAPGQSVAEAKIAPECQQKPPERDQVPPDDPRTDAHFIRPFCSEVEGPPVKS